MKDNHWLFGGIERDTTNAFMEIAEKRDMETLLPIIEREIACKTFIMTDKWKLYNRIEKLDHGYAHYTINHSKNVFLIMKIKKYTPKVLRQC